MISFMNMMGKRPLDDDPDDDEEETSGETGGKKKESRAFMGWSDALVLLVIAALVVGGYKYYQYSKQKSADTFARCAGLYESSELAAAEACYDSTWELSYVTASLDSLRAFRIGAVQDMRNAQLDVFNMAQDQWNAGDTDGAIATMGKLSKPLLLEGDSKVLWEQWESLAAARSAEADTSGTSQPQPKP